MGVEYNVRVIETVEDVADMLMNGKRSMTSDNRMVMLMDADTATSSARILYKALKLPHA